MIRTRSQQGITTSHVVLAVISAVTLLLSSNISAVSAQPAYTTVTGASASTNRGGVLFASIEAGDNIPRFPDEYINSVLVFGYALGLAKG